MRLQEDFVARISVAAARERPEIFVSFSQLLHRRHAAKHASLLVDAISNSYYKHYICQLRYAVNKQLAFHSMSYFMCLRFTASLAPIHSYKIYN